LLGELLAYDDSGVNGSIGIVFDDFRVAIERLS
jgi:hypothetical protein